MKMVLRLMVGVVALSFVGVERGRVVQGQEASGPPRRLSGIDRRIPWTTSNLLGTPGPPDPYRTEPVFESLSFTEPVEMTRVADTDRFLVVERYGKIFTFSENPDQARPELLIDLDRTAFGAAMHPNFEENGYLFVMSISDPTEGAPTGSRVSRFELKSRQPLRADPDSETVLIEWPSGGHNGGCLRFGPDGYLYVATGDGSAIADSRETGQDLSDLLGAMLRIDVDRSQQGLPYAVPPDNPFLDQPGARPEIWAYGLRNAWKYSWDDQGNLWLGDVGQDLWEEINLITRGGNYGWSVREGDHPFLPNRRTGPTPILVPAVEQPHSEFRSITGGHVYYGDRFPELQGDYIYGDYDTGKIWAMRYDSGQVTRNRQLADTELRIIAFAQDSRRRLYLLDFMGQIHRLVRNPERTTDVPDFPTRLSQTGLFESTRDHLPAAGVIPYSVNAQLWSDGATKERFLALPGDSQIEFETVVYPQPAPGAPPGWRFPPNTVLVKTFSLEMEAGNPASRRRLETRLLHFKEMPGTDEVGAQFWRGYTYVWNEEQTDAELLDAKGLDRTYTILDSSAQGGKRTQTWRFPSRSECTMCHTYSAKYALGVDTRQMNKDHDYGGVIANQLSTLQHLGIFKEPLPASVSQLPRLVDYQDVEQPLDKRARAYLHSNCAHCHRKWGGGNADFQLLYTLTLEETGTLETVPSHGRFDLDDGRLLATGQPSRSLILHRMQRLGLGRMPHIGSNVVDQAAVKLIADWIRQLPKPGSGAE